MFKIVKDAVFDGDDQQGTLTKAGPVWIPAYQLTVSAEPRVDALRILSRSGAYELPSTYVTAFHSIYRQPIADTVTVLSWERYNLRIDLIREEFEELKSATSVDAIADALGDLVYVCYGMAIEMGIDLDAVLREIHRSNMTKLGPNGKPVYNAAGKVIKGPNYCPPDLAKALS